jgi:ectoine hydroxylase-related dioxygenase (phytanoyl-CoA dioxygenase family)
MKISYLTDDQISFYQEHGYLHIPQIFSTEETTTLSGELDRLVEEWATTGPGWTGPWRLSYMSPDVEQQSKLTAMHDLYYYSEPWMRAVTHPKLVQCMSDILGPNVELHHSTLHIKPPETGHPFPMHQDNAFYGHESDKYIDVLVHLDDTCHENGEIRFLDGSHKKGILKHVTKFDDGRDCTPHLPVDEYKLSDTVPVPGKKGDVVIFNIYTVHGSHINTTKLPRRLVRIGYRDPDNKQYDGQSIGRPNLMVKGYRNRRKGQELFSTEISTQPLDFAVKI